MASAMPHQPPQEQHIQLSLAGPVINMSLQPESLESGSPRLTDPYTATDRLGLLPMELKVALLAAMPDLETLRTVTLSIPSFYAAYKSRQRHVLFHVLSNDLSPEMLGEACSLHAAGLIRRDERAWKRHTKKFLIDYEVDRALGVCLYDQDVATLRQMALSHLSIQKIAARHVAWAAANRPKIYDSPYIIVAPLSATERTRVYRAYYHFEIFAALFGRTPQAPKRSAINLRTVYHSRVDTLLQSYDEWEVEESNCVRHFVHCFYQDLIKQHASDLGIRFGESVSKRGERMVARTPFPKYLFKYGQSPPCLTNTSLIL